MQYVSLALRERQKNLDYTLKVEYNNRIYGDFMSRKDFLLWQRNLKSQVFGFMIWKRS